jgi:hypothetical protein
MSARVGSGRVAAGRNLPAQLGFNLCLDVCTPYSNKTFRRFSAAWSFETEHAGVFQLNYPAKQPTRQLKDADRSESDV